MGGKPCIRGMGVTVGMIVGQIAAGHSIEEILADYPYLEREDILQALRYAALGDPKNAKSRCPGYETPPDMNLSPRWVEVFRKAGLEAVHWTTVGRADARDREIMAWAAANDYVVLTQDMDFSAILAAIRGVKPSAVQICAEDVSPDVIGTRVAVALLQTRSELESGAIVSIDTERTRLRLLPLIKQEGSCLTSVRKPVP